MANYICIDSVEEQVNYLIDKVKDLKTNKLDKTAVVQETGTGTDVVMSQKAVTDAIANKGLDTLTDVNLTLGNTTVQYDTTNGIQINSTARFQDSVGNHDATMDLALPVVGKDGIVIDKAADSEKIEISGKNFRKVATGSAREIKVYVTKYGDIDSWMFLNSDPDGKPGAEIPQYGTGGTLRANMPATPLDNSVVNKKYVEDNFVKKNPAKDRFVYGKNVVNSTLQETVYYVDQGNFSQVGRIPCWIAPDSSHTLASVNNPVTAKVSTPVGEADIANKKYVDDAIASISPTTQTKWQHNLVLEGTKDGFTFKAFLSIMRPDDTSFGTFDEIINAVGTARIPCTGYVYDGTKYYSIYDFDSSAPVFDYLNPDLGEQMLEVTNADVTVSDDVALEF